MDPGMAGLSVEGDALDRLGTDQLLDLKKSIDARLQQQRGITEGRDNLSQGDEPTVLQPFRGAHPASWRPPPCTLCTMKHSRPNLPLHHPFPVGFQEAMEGGEGGWGTEIPCKRLFGREFCKALRTLLEIIATGSFFLADPFSQKRHDGWHLR